MRLQIYKYILALRPFFSIFGAKPLKSSNQKQEKAINKKRQKLNSYLSCALVGIRTPNLLIRSEMLYPIELQMRFRFVNGLQK